MGNQNLVLPDSTMELVKAVTLFHLTKKDCAAFLRMYQPFILPLPCILLKIMNIIILIHYFLISVKLKLISFLTEVIYILFTSFSFRFNQLERKGRQQGKGKTVGKVSMESICGYIGYARSPFTDGLLDLIDIHHNGNLDFGQFTLLICTYCMFEKIDILKCSVHLFSLLKNT